MTIEELVDRFYHKLNGPDDATAADAMRVVVRALRNEIYLEFDDDETVKEVIEYIDNEILGDAGEKVAGGPTSNGGLKGSAKSHDSDRERKDGAEVSPRPTDPATDPIPDAAPAVCEWQMAGFNWDKRWPQCDPTSGPMFVTYRASIPQKCPLCFRPIKFTEAK